MNTLEKVLLANSVISLGIHVWVFGRWAGKQGGDIEHKAMQHYHKLNQHDSKLHECSDCLTTDYRTLVLPEAQQQ